MGPRPHCVTHRFCPSLLQRLKPIQRAEKLKTFMLSTKRLIKYEKHSFFHILFHSFICSHIHSQCACSHSNPHSHVNLSVKHTFLKPIVPIFVERVCAISLYIFVKIIWISFAHIELTWMQVDPRNTKANKGRQIDINLYQPNLYYLVDISNVYIQRPSHTCSCADRFFSVKYLWGWRSYRILC